MTRKSLNRSVHQVTSPQRNLATFIQVPKNAEVPLTQFLLKLVFIPGTSNLKRPPISKYIPASVIQLMRIPIRVHAPDQVLPINRTNTTSCITIRLITNQGEISNSFLSLDVVVDTEKAVNIDYGAVMCSIVQFDFIFIFVF